MAETVHQETTPAAAEQQSERVFTQAEMNAIITDRLSRERTKYADYDDLKAKPPSLTQQKKPAKPSCRKPTSARPLCKKSWTR